MYIVKDDIDGNDKLYFRIGMLERSWKMKTHFIADVGGNNDDQIIDVKFWMDTLDFHVLYNGNLVFKEKI